MIWLERTAFAVGGILLTSLLFWKAGKLAIAGDFAANAGGAAIGGMISVGLAVLMFQHERKIVAKDMAINAAEQRHESIRQSLRHIRAIRECVLGASEVTINSMDRVITSIKGASKLTESALADLNLTDFPLRLSMEDAAKIGHQTAAYLQSAMGAAGLQDATIPLPAAKDICETAIRSLDELMKDYVEIRKVPSI